MKAAKIKENIYWVGAIDWNLRNFHGYMTQRGSTYNSYLVIDEQITLIDTVKEYLFEELIERISNITDPSKIDNIICNHVEMDHSGSLPKLLRLCPNATIYCSPKAVAGLNAHYGELPNLKPCKNGDSLNTGTKTFKFVDTPMVHWPDNMVCYLEEEKILFSNDSFGQHIASTERFDDEYPKCVSFEEAKKYYANIVLPFAPMVKKALAMVAPLDIEIIAPSHGLIWRENVAEIVENYNSWANNETKEKAVIVYDTMWSSTEKIAKAIAGAFEEKNIRFEMIDLKNSHISDIMTLIIDAKYICVGSPTLNNNILPTVASFLTYLKGLAPKGRTGLAFGSYGWSGQSVGQVEESLKSCGFETLENIRELYIPSEETLKEITKKVLEQL